MWLSRSWFVETAAPIEHGYALGYVGTADMRGSSRDKT
jgi:hypothetical protein